MNRESFVFYKNYKEALEYLTEDENISNRRTLVGEYDQIRLAFYDTIINYVFDGKLPNDKTPVIASSMFYAIKRELDTEQKAYQSFKQRTSTEYQKFKRAVLIRDNYMCQLCGSEENLEVHHKLSFKDYPELRTDVSNGITLCHACHKKEHSNGKE